MKIVHIITSLTSGGAEKLVLELVKINADQGIETSVLVLSGRPSPFLEKLESDERIKVYKPNSKRSVYHFSHIFRIKKILSKYDIAHVHLFPTFYWTAIASLFSSSKVLVYTEHNTNNRRRNHIILKYVDRIIYKRYNALITISDSVDSALKKHLKQFDPKRIFKIYNGINLSEIREAEPLAKISLGVNPEDIVILQVSSFTPQKNQPFLIEAMKFLPKNYKLILVGEGPTMSSCKELVKNEKLENKVLFAGIRGDVPNLLKTADVVVLASHFEGLSLASVEGLASGSPFLASDVPGLQEVVRGYGILFQNDKPIDLAIKIQEVIDNKELASEIIQSSLQRSANFDIRVMSSAYHDLYSKLLRQ